MQSLLRVQGAMNQAGKCHKNMFQFHLARFDSLLGMLFLSQEGRIGHSIKSIERWGMFDQLASEKKREILQIFLIVLLIAQIGCAQVDVSLDADNTVQRPYIFDKDDPRFAAATPLCPLTTPLISNKQKNGVWCWAASAQMTINYLRAFNGLDTIEQCDIVNMLLTPPTGINCCKAEDGYDPADPETVPSRNHCSVRRAPLDALQKLGYNADRHSPPLKWDGLSEQLCTKRVPYIGVVQFYDNDGTLAGRHSSVIGGGRVTPDGEKYIEVTDHSEDDFFVMKWEAFDGGVRGDFVHDYDLINLR